MKKIKILTYLFSALFNKKKKKKKKTDDYFYHSCKR